MPFYFEKCAIERFPQTGTIFTPLCRAQQSNRDSTRFILLFSGCANQIAAREQSTNLKLKDLMPENWFNQNLCPNEKKSIITEANENLSSVHCGQLKIHMTMFYPTRKKETDEMNIIASI